MPDFNLLKKILVACGAAVLLLVGLAANSHRVLPVDMDPCQEDMSHQGQISELPFFHCLGHKEYAVDFEQAGLFRVESWYHLHPWMTLEWHLEQGFDREQAVALIDQHTTSAETE